MGLINFFKKLFTTENTSSKNSQNILDEPGYHHVQRESPEVLKAEISQTSEEIEETKVEETKVEEPKVVSENKPKKRRYYPKKKKSVSSGEPNTAKKSVPKKPKGPSKA